MLKDKLKEIIAIVEESDVHEVEVSTWWGRKIRVTKNASDPSMSSLPASNQAASEIPATGTSVPQPAAATEETAPGPMEDTSSYQSVHAPIVGTFYRAASPESPPYINVGDKISVSQVICIIEAMKIMNEIESDMSGTVVDILVENASPVEYNQPLVVVDPS